MNEKIAMISLGCPKNQVDSELMLFKLNQAGFEIIDTAQGADAVIINTCGFIDDAKKEAIENILTVAQLKEQGLVGKIIVIGCMAQRYQDEILKEMPEVDAVGGIGVNGDIVAFVKSVLAEEKKSEFPEKTLLPLNGRRILSTPDYWAYLKISDGCSNCCTYCAIPMIRGKFRSRAMEDILEEANTLVKNGVRELIVIAQDTTRYGLDLYGELKLAELLKRLDAIKDLRWIRLLYCYPDRLTDEVLTVMRDSDKILHYIDLPLQHASGKILKAMNRVGNEESLLALIEKIRSYMPDCVIRTTFITGFPGETEQDFNILSEFVQKAEFDRLGCFAYSPEEGTLAATLPNQVDNEVAVHRGEVIMEQQYGIYTDKQVAHFGEEIICVVEDYDEEAECYVGRTWMDAPEIDSNVFILSDEPLPAGTFVKVEITGVDGYDLVGEVIV